MDQLETLVRDALAGHADDAPDGDRLLSGIARRPRRLLAALTAAAVIVAVAVGVVVFRPNNHNSTAPAAPPPGTKPIAYHGITIHVPREMKLTSLDCGATLPTFGVAEASGAALMCPYHGNSPPKHPRPVRLLVWITPLAHSVPSFATEPTSVDGVPARRGYGTLRNRYVDLSSSGALVVPSLDAVIVVSAPNRSSIDAILNTAVSTPLDKNGCLAQRASMTPSGNTPSADLVPDRPASVVWCQYTIDANWGARTRWLATSRSYGAAEAVRLAATIDALPRRVTSRQSSGSFAIVDSLLIFRYPDGTREIGVDWRPVDRAPLQVTDGLHIAYDSESALETALVH
jgi:hypothetical protein